MLVAFSYCVAPAAFVGFSSHASNSPGVALAVACYRVRALTLCNGWHADTQRTVQRMLSAARALQIDSSVFKGRACRLRIDEGIRVGGQGAVAFAEHEQRPSSQYAIKFYFSQHAFLTEKAVCNDNSLKPAMPAVFDVLEGDNRDALERHLPEDLRAPLPPMIVTERGECLDDFVYRQAPDFVTVLQVCTARVQDVLDSLCSARTRAAVLDVVLDQLLLVESGYGIREFPAHTCVLAACCSACSATIGRSICPGDKCVRHHAAPQSQRLLCMPVGIECSQGARFAHKCWLVLPPPTLYMLALCIPPMPCRAARR